jgi:hypothetical protein
VHIRSIRPLSWKSTRLALAFIIFSNALFLEVDLGWPFIDFSGDAPTRLN